MTYPPVFEQRTCRVASSAEGRPVKSIRSILAAWLAAIAMSSVAQAQTPDVCARPAIPKVEHDGVEWRPGPGGEQTPLWPEGLAIQPPDEDRPEMTGSGSPLVAGRTWNWATFVTRPTMTIYRPVQQRSRAAVLVLPGGGYVAVAMDLEGTEICDWVTQQGVTCIVLKYRTPQAWRRGQPPAVLLPLQDAQRAMGLLRQHAADYDIDPNKIGVIGFSAGAHLAAAISNADSRTYDSIDAADLLSPRPNFAVLLYTGRLWDRTAPRTSLTLAPWVEISPNAPPTLLIHAMNDPVDDVRHAMAYGLALHDAGVPVDMRIYAGGCHAFGLRPTADPITTQWPGMVLQWLRDIHVF
jgi:acetyl esterase/lipase